MKNRVGLIVLTFLCVGLVCVGVSIRKHAREQHQLETHCIEQYSNRVVSVSDQLERQKQINAIFEKEQETQKQAYAELTNNYASLAVDLAQASATLSKTEEKLKTIEQEAVKREAEIAALETRNQALDEQALELSTSITNLTLQIAEAQRKLIASEGDKAFLEAELKRLMSQKAYLERQFSDLTALRTQMARLKEQQNIARRIAWIRQGLLTGAEQKGAQKLLQGVQVAQSKPAYDLNVEVSAAGSVNVISPTPPTNAPPAR